MDSLNKGINSIHQKVNLISSYSYIYKNPKKPIEFPRNRNQIMMDSGAFDLIIRENRDEFPFSPKEYAESIKKLEITPNYVVSMDYICSPENKKNNIDLIYKTIENAKILRSEFKRGEGICFIPVVQGYDVKEYLLCIKELVNKKIVQNGDYIGIGSLAKRRTVKEPREIIKSIYQFLTKKKISVKLHCFGLNLNIIKDESIFNIIKSIDSLAWTFPYRFGRVKMFTSERMIEANSNNQLKEPEFYYLSLDATLKYIEFLNLKYNRFQRRYSKSIDKILECKPEDNSLELYKKIAKNLQISTDEINNVKSRNELLNLVLKFNRKFPRDLELNIEKIPTYTGKKFLILEPKNSKIGKREFLYLLVSSLENAYKNILLKNKNEKQRFLNFLKSINNKFDKNDFKIIKEVLVKYKMGAYYDYLFNSANNEHNYIKFNSVINEIKEKIELKLYKLPEYSHFNQSKLNSKMIKNEYFLLHDDINF